MDVTLRSPEVGDAEALGDLLRRNRAHFATGQPVRPEGYDSTASQATVIAEAQRARDNGAAAMFLIETDGRLVGKADLNSVIRGAFQSASVGYLVDEAYTGRGVATAALRLLVRHAFDALNLHRLQGETLVDNLPSQRVLLSCGFVHYGTAPDYLRLQGRWQTNALYQLINPAWREPGGTG